MSVSIKGKLGRGYCRQAPGAMDSSHVAKNRSLGNAYVWKESSTQ